MSVKPINWRVCKGVKELEAMKWMVPDNSFKRLVELLGMDWSRSHELELPCLNLIDSTFPWYFPVGMSRFWRWIGMSKFKIQSKLTDTSMGIDRSNRRRLRKNKSTTETSTAMQMQSWLEEIRNRRRMCHKKEERILEICRIPTILWLPSFVQAVLGSIWAVLCMHWVHHGIHPDILERW